jgi:hypothetical protein
MRMREDGDDADMAAALDQFDRVAANVEKLEAVWERLCELTQDETTFGLDTPERDIWTRWPRPSWSPRSRRRH